MVYLVNTTWTPKDASQILSLARASVDEQIIVRDARVADAFVELDCSLPDEIPLDRVLEDLKRVSMPLEAEQIIERTIGDEEAVGAAVRRFNDQKYWGAHEALEQVWKRSAGAEKDLVNGIILVAAAFVHAQKDEQDICLSILKRALDKLGNARGTYRGIDIDSFKTRVKSILSSGKIEQFQIEQAT